MNGYGSLLTYEASTPGHRGIVWPEPDGSPVNYDEALLRTEPPELPELSEPEVVRHFTRLSQLNFSVDTHFYPLGSCTMKYNPKIGEAAANMPGFRDVHPLLAQLPGGARCCQGALQVLYETERLLAEITGMAEFTLQPLAGAHGELTGVMIMAAYHRQRGNRKTHILIPDSAHGTNPASASLGGYEIRAVRSDEGGQIDLKAFREAVNDETAGMMLTCPNTLGLFMTGLPEIVQRIHEVDGLVYYDGANLNAILGRVKPAHLGFDICHLNLHKTFATPHGGGGPGSGPVGVVEKLRRFLPVPRVVRKADGTYELSYDAPDSIGCVAPFYGNFAVILRAYVYLQMVGREGLREVSNCAVLNANYLLARLRNHLSVVGDGRCMHECVFSVKPLLAYGVRALDVAKALIDRGFHPPTIYFPLIVPEALMVEPTETENRATLDAFVNALIDIIRIARESPERLREAPITTPVGRLDEVQAAKRLDVAYNMQ